MRISKYLNKTVIVEHKKGDETDDYGQYEYLPEQEVPAAIQVQRKLVQNSMGSYVQVGTSVFLDTEISEGDKINGRTVEAILVITNALGDAEGYEAMLK